MAEILITGATGCIGRALVFRAVTEGWSVRGLARSEPPSWWPRDLSYIRADIGDRDAVARAAAGCSAVVHLAAPVHAEALALGAEKIHRATVDGASSAANAAHLAHASLVMISTIGVYGTPPPPRCDDATPTRPRSSYAHAKLAAEDRARRDHGAPTVLRCAVVYGPGDRGNVGRMITAIDRGRGLIVGRGQNYKSVLFAENLADRILLCATDRTMSGTWCVADAPAVSQYELAREIGSALGKRPPLSVPVWLAASAATLLDWSTAARAHKQSWRDAIRTLTATTVVDGSALDRRIAYEQRWSLPEALQQTVAWLRSPAA